MSNSAFPALTTAEQVFKDLVWNPMIKAGEVWIETEAPIFAAPIIKQIEEGSIGVVTDYVFNLLTEFIDVETIKLVNDAHQSAFDNESLKLKIVLLESGVNSDAYKKERDLAAQALSRFTRFQAG